MLMIILFIKESIALMNRYPDQIYIDHDVTFNRELRKSLDRNNMINVKFKYAIKEEINDIKRNYYGQIKIL